MQQRGTEYQRAVTKLHDDAIKTLHDLKAETSSSSASVVLSKTARNQCIALRTEIDALNGIVEKFEAKVSEKDPDKQTYGPKMREKLAAFVEEFRRFNAELPDVLSNVTADYGTVTDDEQQRPISEAQASHDTVAAGRQETEREETERQQILQRKLELQQQHEQRERQVRASAERAERELVERRNALLKKYEETIQRLNCAGARSHCEQGIRKLMATPQERRSIPSLAEPLITLLSEIHSEPHRVEYRVLRLLNTAFMTSIGSLPGSMEILQAVGFRLKRFAEIRDLVEADDEPYLVLDEPDPLADFAAWEQWLRHIQDMLDLVKTRC